MALAGASRPALPGVRGKKPRTPGSAGVGENGVRAQHSSLLGPRTEGIEDEEPDTASSVTLKQPEAVLAKGATVNKEADGGSRFGTL
ncbi:hypothetical protein NDU88_005399 [Pleurodeles waltl]|uniref:Uncharacterized protein n=1 Tax=Pleurodeles waltl TaxID=8319 RepID=A0AAV7VJV7_PLEWA|nr:hypothetical protein NDU88_005399 [Pleurodeles waltl]